MTHHWPILASGALICAATAFGLWQRDAAINAAAPQEVVPPAIVAPQPQSAAPAAILERKTEAPAPAPSVPAGSIAVKAAGPAEAMPVSKVLPTPVAAPASAPVPPGNIVAGLRDGMPPIPPQQIFLELRNALQTQLGAPATELPGGGFAFSSKGARLEVQPLPNWSIIIYNLNGKTPEIETGDFKTCLTVVTASLNINMMPKPIDTPTGKTSLKTICRLGSISLDRDPANGNSCLISPMQRRIK